MADLENIDPKCINWKLVGKRLAAYRLVSNVTAKKLADRCEISTVGITNLENGKPVSHCNSLWSIVTVERLSPNWLFLGIGPFKLKDSVEGMPSTLMHQRGRGVRRDANQLDSDEGQYHGRVMEFVLAVDAYKQYHGKSLPTWTEIFELIVSLGYRKIARPTINPKRPWEKQDNKNDSSKSNGNRTITVSSLN